MTDPHRGRPTRTVQQNAQARPAFEELPPLGSGILVEGRNRVVYTADHHQQWAFRIKPLREAAVLNTDGDWLVFDRDDADKLFDLFGVEPVHLRFMKRMLT